MSLDGSVTLAIITRMVRPPRFLLPLAATLLAVLLQASSHAVPEYIVTTIAGGTPPDVGHGWNATDAILNNPFNVTVAPDGTLYIVDTDHSMIRQLKDGKLWTIAGRAASDDRTLGDGGPATEATLRLPRDVAIAPDGTIYIVDTNHYSLRRVDRDGIITTLGGGCTACRGLTDDGDGGPISSATFTSIYAVVLDEAGNIYVADRLTHRVRRIGRDQIITTIAGTGTAGNGGDGGPAARAQLNFPTSLAIRNRTQLLIGDAQALRAVDLASGVITTLARIPARHFALDGNDRIVFSAGAQVRLLDLRTGAVSVVAGSGRTGFAGDGGLARDAQFFAPAGVAVDAAGRIYVADSRNDRVRRINPDGRIETVVGSGKYPGENAPALQATIYDTEGAAIDRRGNVYFSDVHRGTIRRLSPDGHVTTIAGNRRATSPGEGGHPLSASFARPAMLQFDRHGQLLFLNVQNNSRGVVRLITPGADGVIDGSADERVVTMPEGRWMMRPPIMARPMDNRQRVLCS